MCVVSVICLIIKTGIEVAGEDIFGLMEVLTHIVSGVCLRLWSLWMWRVSMRAGGLDVFENVNILLMSLLSMWCVTEIFE